MFCLRGKMKARLNFVNMNIIWLLYFYCIYSGVHKDRATSQFSETKPTLNEFEKTRWCLKDTSNLFHISVDLHWKYYVTTELSVIQNIEAE